MKQTTIKEKEHDRQRCKDYHKKHRKDKNRKSLEYYYKHKQQIKECHKKYVKENREYLNKYHNEYIKTPNGKKYIKKYYKNNKDKIYKNYLKYLRTEKGKIKMKEMYYKRHKKGFIQILPNIFPKDISVDYHHVDGKIFVVPVPRNLHLSISGIHIESHIENANDWIEFYYGIHPEEFLHEL